MFRNIVISLILLVTAQTVMAAGATKVAVLDLRRAVTESTAGQEGFGQLKSNPEYAAVIAKIENLGSEIKSLEEKGKNEGLTWGEDKKKETQAQMLDLAKERQANIGNIQRAQETVFMQLLKLMEEDINIALKDIVEKEGIELIVDAEAVRFQVPTADITLMTIERLNFLYLKRKEAAESGELGEAKKDKKKD